MTDCSIRQPQPYALRIERIAQPMELRRSGRIATVLLLAGIAAGLLFAPASAQPPVPAAPAPAWPWMNPNLSPDDRANLLLEEMNEDERLTLVMGYFGSNLNLGFTRPSPAFIKPFLVGTAGYIRGIPRLGVPPLIESDAGVGIANNGHARPGDTATAFPATLATAATFNPKLAFEVGNAIGAEARARGYNVMLDGSLNLAREPRGGRTFEYAGEDPLLAGAIAGEEIHGIQSQHVISTIKHYALNDQETGRGILSANIEEAAMRESDLLAFEIAIERGSPGAVMCAYNKVNEDYSCENGFLLNRVLKGDWNYPGWVLSDWGGVHSTVQAAKAGLDQESAREFDGYDFFGDALKKAVDSGAVDHDRLHDMAHRILRSMFAVGIFDYPMSKSAPPLAASAATAERDAEQGIVLLKNDNDLLPLSKSIRSIAVIGERSDSGMLSGGGSSQVIPIGDNPSSEFLLGGPVITLGNGAKYNPLDHLVFDPPSPLAEIKAEAPHALVRFDDGSDLAAMTKLAHDSDVAIYFARKWRTENEDIASLDLPDRETQMINAVLAANPHTIVVLETGGPALMPWVDQAQGVIEAWYAGNGGAKALARILFGDVNPSGRLPITFPVSESQLPHPVLPGRDWHGGPFDVDYSEGADIGYRWFEKQKQTALFPFGFGLSYTHFSFSNVHFDAGDTITAYVDVTNDGKREGQETVQFYAAPPNGVSRLVGFEKVDLAPGQTKHVILPAEPRLLAHFDTDNQRWRIADGTYAAAVGASSADLGAPQMVTMAAREMNP
jgi:beta-glucosidase